jgi:hypothetical protein
MKNEELYISSRMGHENHFRVPEGYFDNFAERLMSELPERRKPLMVRLRPWMYAAACFVGAVSLVAVYFHAPDNPADTHVASVSYAETYFDEAADYAMVDNQDIYACLSSEF